MKIALVHDDLVQWGGAERVLETLSEIFPDAPIYTAVFDKGNLILNQKFGNKEVKSSFIQKIPFWRKLYKPLFFLHPLAFEQFDFTDYDLVISQTTRFAKAIITKPKTMHISYCHTPPRFLWSFSGFKTPFILQKYLSFLRFYDLVTARRVDTFIAGSVNSQKRIKKIYKRDSFVLQPFIDPERFKNVDSFEGDYYLVVSRLNGYKKIDVAIKACQKLKKRLLVVGIGPEKNKLEMISNNDTQILGSVSEKTLINLMSGCKALIVTAEEDFGLTSLEVQALGKPVIAYGQGGSLESVKNNITGIFFEAQNEESLSQAILRFEKMKFDPINSISHAQKFSKFRFQTQLLQILQDVSLRIASV